MKIQIMSDVHLEFAEFTPPITDVDVVVLAGDIGVASNGVTWAKETFDVPVVYVAGNHEFYSYDGSMNTLLTNMRDEASGSNVHVLERNCFEFEGVRFLGTTLWTDLLAQPYGGVKCGVLSSDACYIGLDDGEFFSDIVAQDLFEKNRDWLFEQLQKPYKGKTVVISHHAPSGRSMHPQYAGNPWNSCFVTDMESIMGDSVDLWIHGHTHNNFDYVEKGTRVICNPRGYPRPFGGLENPSFDQAKVVQL